MNDGTPPVRNGMMDGFMDEDAIRTQLDRILGSDHFDASERNRRFLRYVVEECLAGRSQQIKAYCIAVSVFNREPSFDPQSDPIVRLEAGRLRRSLEHYYLTAGRDDPIRIVVPKGGYSPRFEPLNTVEDAQPAEIDREPQEAAPAPFRPFLAHPPWIAAAAPVAIVVVVGLFALLFSLWGHEAEPEEALALATPQQTVTTVAPPIAGGGTGIVVSPFRTAGGPPDADAVASVMTDEVVRALTVRSDLPIRLDLHRAEVGTRHDLRLAGSILNQGGVLRAVVHLTDLSTGTVLWSEQIDQPAGAPNAPTSYQDLAAAIVAPLTDPQGPVAQTLAPRLRAKPVASLTPRECAFLAAESRDRPADERAALTACLNKAAADRTRGAAETSRLWAALSFLEADTHRAAALGHSADASGGDQPPPLDRALSAALHATELAPAGLRPLTALYTAYCLRRQYDACFTAGDRAIRAAPDDSRVLGDLGLWHVEAGDAARGAALLERAMDREPRQAARLLPAYSLARQRQGEEPVSAPRTDLTGAAPAQAALAVTFVQSGRLDDAREAATRALAADPDFIERTAREQRNRPLPPDLDATIRNSFAVVGLTH